MRKVIIKSDDESLKEFLKQRLTSDGFDVADHGTKGIYILDLTESKNFMAIEIVRMQSKIVPIICIIDEEEDALACLRKGADSYVIMPFDPYELSIRARLAGERYSKRLALSNEP